MAYFLDLFSPETYKAFSRSDRSVSGFRVRHCGAAGRVRPGAKLLCYMTKLSRWVGVLDVVDGTYEDDAPVFYAEGDPFVVRFHVRAAVCLPVEKAVPIPVDEDGYRRLATHRMQRAEAGVFTDAFVTLLKRYARTRGIAWQWTALDAFLVKAPKGGTARGRTRRTGRSVGPSGTS